jgi:TIR domain/Domain of unknown function (DUF4062)/WD domain, G-beta repeat
MTGTTRQPGSYFDLAVRVLTDTFPNESLAATINRALDVSDRVFGGYVFISYARDDRAYVARLASTLVEHGIPVWYDEMIQGRGEQWRDALRVRIEKSAAIVVVMTPAAASSRWVAQEIQQARNRDHPIYPMLLEGQPLSSLADLRYESVEGAFMPSAQYLAMIRERVPASWPRGADSASYALVSNGPDVVIASPRGAGPAGAAGGVPADPRAVVPARAGSRVFVSHTSELAEPWPYVASVISEVNRAGLVPVDMRWFPPSDDAPADVCRRNVAQTQVYVGVIGFQYGSVVDGLDVSYTELEFDAAAEAGIARLVVMMRTAPADTGLVDADRSRIDRFRDKVTSSGITVGWFEAGDNPGILVYQGLTDLLHGRGFRAHRGPGWLMTEAAGEHGRDADRTGRDHFTSRGLGQQGRAQGGDLFRGRAKALSAVSGWLDAPRPPGRVLVVTGRPGAGKSAVVARAVLEADKAAIASGEPRRRGLAFHARGAVLADFLTALARHTATPVAVSVEEMIDRLQPSGGDRPVRVVVDALDEAANDQDRRLLAKALTELAGLPNARVVVATRPLAVDYWFAPDSLLYLLGVRSATAANLVDLDSDEYFDPAGLRAFAAALLCQHGATNPGPPDAAWAGYRANPALRDRLAGAVAERANRNHLVAALTAHDLSRADDTVDPAGSGFDRSALAGTVGEALDKYLNPLDAAERVRVRSLLTALAYARGAGVDDEVWLSFAAALRRPTTTAELNLDLDALRTSPAADYLLQSSTLDGARLTRLFHEALAEHLLASRHRSTDEAKLLSCLIPTPPATWADTTGYAKTFAAQHAAAAHRLADLLDDPAYPTVADLTRLLPLLPPITGPSLAGVVGMLRMAGVRAHDLNPVRRAGLFALTAAHLGLTGLARRYHQPPNPTITWAHTRGSGHQTLTGHTGWVLAVALGRAGGRDVVVSGGGDATVRVWDAASGHPVGNPLTGHTGWVRAVALGRAGGRDVVVSGGADATVRVWDAASGIHLLSQDTHDPVYALAIMGNLLTFAAGTTICAATLT